MPLYLYPHPHPHPPPSPLPPSTTKKRSAGWGSINHHHAQIHSTASYPHVDFPFSLFRTNLVFKKQQRWGGGRIGAGNKRGGNKKDERGGGFFRTKKKGGGGGFIRWFNITSLQGLTQAKKKRRDPKTTQVVI